MSFVESIESAGDFPSIQIGNMKSEIFTDARPLQPSDAASTFHLYLQQRKYYKTLLGRECVCVLVQKS